MSMKNPLTLAGIEPATFRFVAQHLNHCATAAPEVDVPGVEFRWRRDFPQPSKPALGPIQVTGVLSRGVELTTYLHLVPRLKKG